MLPDSDFSGVPAGVKAEGIMVSTLRKWKEAFGGCPAVKMAAEGMHSRSR